MSYEPLHHKYRPQTFADLVGQEAIATTLTNAILTQKIAPAYLFTGPRGTGKTSSARILAKSLNCLKSNTPTAQPCGVCDVCQGVTKGATLDVIEIDAASNTGVDNIRELIERAQFAPVQCRYKVYVVDECLTGDSLVLSDRGLVRIDDPSIKGKKVLSYNDSSQKWEFKKVLRWLDQGERQTLIIKTTNREIRCTGNHLVRTEQGWIPAKDVKEGAKILSPVNVDVATSFTNLGRMDVPENLPEDTSLKAIPTGKNCTILPRTGSIALPQKDLPGGIKFTAEVLETRHTTTSTWVQAAVDNGFEIFKSIQSSQWITSLETVKSVRLGKVERVYDIEVEDNHNFVANGLSLHNCHMLSTAAFNALLKTLEEPPEHVVFVLATTDPQRVLPTIISRCQRFDFRRIAIDAMVQHLSAIASIEKISITPEAVHLIASFAQGGLRDAESLLDQLSLLSGQVTVERVWDLVGSVAEPDLLELLQAIAQNNPEALLDCARRIMDRGKEPLTLLQNLASFYRDLLIAKTAPNRSNLVTITPASWKALCEQAKTWEVSSILAGQQHLAKSEVQIKTTTQPRLWLEVTLLGLLPANSIQPSISPTQTQHQQVVKNQPQMGQEIVPPAHQPAPPNQIINAVESVPASIQPETQSIVKQVEQSAPVPAPTGAVENIPAKSESINVANSVELPSEQWQQVLAHLQPNSTQALLRQMGHLIEFNGKVARIGMRSKAWCNQAKAYVPNIKAAFKATFNQEVEVKLELATATQTNNTPVKESPVNHQASDPVASPPVNQPIASQIAATASERTQAITQLQPETTPKESPAEQTAAPNMDVVSNAATASAEWDDREVAIAAQRLADFFNGEVVLLKDDATFVQPTATTNIMPPSDSELYNVVDAEGDVDIDF